MKRQLIFSHGSKGGVGKSTVAALLVDMAVRRYGATSLIEGDVTNPDVLSRYSSHPRVTAKLIPLNRPGPADAACKLADWLECHNPESNMVTVVNLPPNAGETLNGQAALLAEVFDDLEYEVSICYSIDNSVWAGSELARALSPATDRKLLSMVKRENLTVLIPEFSSYFDDRYDRFMPEYMAQTGPHTLERASQPRPSFCVLPALAPEVAGPILREDVNTAFSEIRAGCTERFGVREVHALQSWLTAAERVLSRVFRP